MQNYSVKKSRKRYRFRLFYVSISVLSRIKQRSAVYFFSEKTHSRWIG